MYFLISIFLSSMLLYAHQPTETVDKVGVHWNTNQIPLQINSQNDDIDSSTAFGIIQDSIVQWNTSTPVFITNSGSSSNKLMFTNNTAYFGSGILAVTKVNYSASSGSISNAQILLNQTALFSQRFFQFVSDPTNTNAYNVYLGDVVTHELGHFLGLSHSEVLDSSMVYSAFKGQATPSQDDISGVRTIYAKNSYASISGVVQGGNSIPIFGAHVMAISQSTGQVAGAIFSREDGSFKISGLDINDSYLLYVAPIKKVSKLIESLSTVQTNFCPGTFVGSFFERCTDKGHPQAIELTSGDKNKFVGVVSIRCETRVAESYLREKYISGSSGYYEFDDTTSNFGETFVGSFLSQDLSETDYADSTEDIFSINLDDFVASASPNYYLDIKIVSEALGTPLSYEVQVTGPTGVMTYTSTTDPITQKIILDQIIHYKMSTDSTQNTFSIRIRPKKIMEADFEDFFPSPDDFVNKRYSYLVLVGVSEKINSEYWTVEYKKQPLIYSNQMCLDAPFAFNVKANTLSQGTIAAASGQADGQQAEQPSATACGTINMNNSGPPSSGGSFLLGLGITLLIFFPKNRKKFLS